LHGGDKAFRITDQMIGRQHQQDGLRVTGHGVHGAERNRGRGIARDRFQNDGGTVYQRLEQLIRDQETMIVTGHHDGRTHVRKLLGARHGLLEQRALTTERQELLWQIFAGYGPQARAATAAENKGNQHDGPFAST
jgi:hypothetical protein